MVVSFWKPSLIDAHTFINQGQMYTRFIQFVEDKTHTKGIWIVMRMSSDELENIVESDKLSSALNKQPRLTFIN